MSKTLQEIWDDNCEAELHAKTAAIDELWGDDELRCQLLDDSIDLVKEAQEAGSLPEDMVPADVFSLAVSLVNDFTKEAGLDDDCEEKITKEAADAAVATGEILLEIVKEAGINVDDIPNMTDAEQTAIADYAEAVYAGLCEE